MKIPHWLHSNMAKICLLVFVPLFLASAWSARIEAPASPAAIINGHKFNIEVARTTEERARGLGGRDSLPPENGMLFVFEKAGKHCFWMLDTRISLDMLWFDENDKLIHIERQVSPDSYPQQFCPPGNARNVLELKSGMADFIKAENGNQLYLSNLNHN